MNEPTSHPETKVEVLERIPGFPIIREFEAPVSAVFRAHCDPDLYAHWIGPSRLATTLTRWDCTRLATR
jgi:hypothetical protein